MILCHLATEARDNFRILTNSALCRDRDLAPYFLPIDLSVGKGAAVVPIYIHGRNSRSFHIASKIPEPLRMALFIREARSKFGESFRADIGKTITAGALCDFPKRSALTKLLYHRVQDLAHVA